MEGEQNNASPAATLPALLLYGGLRCEHHQAVRFHAGKEKNKSAGLDFTGKR